nr:DUF1365 domain-containing protein [uncultured Cohaesibacter sp.]
MTDAHPLHFSPDPCLYRGQVSHVRQGQADHSLTYRVASLLLPLYRMDEAAKASTWFSINRFNLFSFHEKDHMDEGHPSLESFVQHCLLTSGQYGADETLPTRISLLAFPRFLGHAFNPLSIFFCCDQNDQLQAILYQVRNTFGQRHHYLYRVDPSDIDTEANARLRHGGDKQFYVSPFLAMDGHYEFVMRLPGEKAKYRITMSGNQPASLTAAFSATRQPLTNGSLLRLAGMLWQGGWKILGAIHIEALKLWLKGARFHKRPPLPSEPVTSLTPTPAGKGPTA